MNKELKKVPSMQRVNSMVMITYSVMAWIMFFAYMLEFVKGSRSVLYTAIFAALDMLPWTLCLMGYMKNKSDKK